jgi:hypothetical protein
VIDFAPADTPDDPVDPTTVRGAWTEERPEAPVDATADPEAVREPDAVATDPDRTTTAT